MNQMVSVILPCWNEAENLRAGALDEVASYFAGKPFGWEAILVDDGSTDGSRELLESVCAQKKGFRLVTIPHSGKPAAVWTGLREAQGDIVVFSDMDQSTPIGELDKLLPWFSQGYAAVIGSRGLARQGTSVLRKLGSFLFGATRRTFLLRGIHDTQCGFKACLRAAAMAVFPRLEYLRWIRRPRGWKVTAYDVELLFLFEQMNYRIKEVEVRWQNRDRSTTKGQTGSRNRYLLESFEMAREILRVKLNQLRGYYYNDGDPSQ